MNSNGRIILGTEWTNEEIKNLMTQIERCSQHDPELISRRLKSKSTVQVAAMISHLRKKFIKHEQYIMQNQRLPPLAMRTKTQDLKQEVLQARRKSRWLDRQNCRQNDNLQLTRSQIETLELLDVYKMQQLAAQIYEKEESGMQPVLLTLTSLELCHLVRNYTKGLIDKAILIRKQKLLISASSKKNTLVIVASDVHQAAESN